MSWVPLIAVAVIGIVVVARSGTSAPCAAGQICPAPPECVSPSESRRQARTAVRGPGRGLAPFGFNDGSILAGQASPDEIAVLHRDIGARLIRFALDWRRVEPQPQSYDFRAEDAIYCAAMRRGIAPVIVIAGAPAWAAVPAGDCVGCLRPPKSEHLDSLAELARIVAERYPGAAAIEAWNEPNLGLFWESPDPAAYVNVLRAIREGVRQSRKPMPVLGG